MRNINLFFILLILDVYKYMIYGYVLRNIYKVLFGKVLIFKFLIVNEICFKVLFKSFLILVVNFCVIYLGIVKFIFFVFIKLF